MRKGKYFTKAIIALFVIIVVFVIYELQDYNRQEIYVQVENTDSFPIKINLYNNELIELSPLENTGGYPYDSKSSNDAISLDSLGQFFRNKSPLKIKDYKIYVVQENLNGEKRTIPTNLAYVLID